MSNRYTHGHDESVLRSHRWRTVENSCAYLLPELRTGRSVLDVGCGPGTITVDLARRVAPAPVHGVDRAEEVLADARGAVERSGVTNVTLRAADVGDLPYDDGAFAVVHAHQVLQHLADPAGALAEMARVCAPDGVVAVRDSDYGAMTWFPADPWLDRWREVYAAVARRNGGEPDAGRHLPSWARAAGLDDVRPGTSQWCFADEESRRWWGGLWADRVTGSRLGRDALAGGLVTAAELPEIAAAWHRWAAAPDGWFVVPHGEILARPPRR